MQGPYVTIDELADIIRTPRKTIYKWTHEKSIPHIKVGRRLLFDREEIELWIASKRVAPVQV